MRLIDGTIWISYGEESRPSPIAHLFSQRYLRANGPTRDLLSPPNAHMFGFSNCRRAHCFECLSRRRLYADAGIASTQGTQLDT